MIYNVNVSPIKYINRFHDQRGKVTPKPIYIIMLSFNSEPHGTHKMLVETFSRLFKLIELWSGTIIEPILVMQKSKMAAVDACF